MIKYIEAGIIAIVAILAPIHSLLITTGLMIFMDLITGVLAARKRGEPITSAGLRRTISKLFVYELAIVLAFIVEHYMSDVLPFVKMISAMVAIVELKSVYENIDEIGGNTLLKTLVDKLGSANDEPKS